MRRCTAPVAGSRNSSSLPTVSPISRLLPSGRQRPMVRLAQARGCGAVPSGVAMSITLIDAPPELTTKARPAAEAQGARAENNSSGNKASAARMIRMGSALRQGGRCLRLWPRLHQAAFSAGRQKGFQRVPGRCDEQSRKNAEDARPPLGTRGVRKPGRRTAPPDLLARGQGSILQPIRLTPAARARTPPWRTRTARRRGWRSARCR